MILGSAQLGGLTSQLGGISWFAFLTDPRIILLVGAYLTMIDTVGEYRTTLDVIGEK